MEADSRRFLPAFRPGPGSMVRLLNVGFLGGEVILEKGDGNNTILVIVVGFLSQGPGGGSPGGKAWNNCIHLIPGAAEVVRVRGEAFAVPDVRGQCLSLSEERDYIC